MSATSPDAAGLRAILTKKIATALRTESDTGADVDTVAAEIEVEVNERFTKKEYSAKGRSLVFNLNKNAELRARVLAREVPAAWLVTASVSELATDAQKLARQVSAERFYAQRSVGASDELVVGWNAGTSGKLDWSHKYESEQPSSKRSAGLIGSAKGGSGGGGGAIEEGEEEEEEEEEEEAEEEEEGVADTEPEKDTEGDKMAKASAAEVEGGALGGDVTASEEASSAWLAGYASSSKPSLKPAAGKRPQQESLSSTAAEAERRPVRRTASGEAKGEQEGMQQESHLTGAADSRAAKRPRSGGIASSPPTATHVGTTAAAEAEGYGSAVVRRCTLKEVAATVELPAEEAAASACVAAALSRVRAIVAAGGAQQGGARSM
jgi:hypothetical protein